MSIYICISPNKWKEKRFVYLKLNMRPDRWLRMTKKDRAGKKQSFIKRTMGRDEHLIMVARLHWFYLVVGFTWFLGFVVTGISAEALIWHYFESNIPPFERDILGLNFNSRGAVLKWFLTIVGSAVLIYHIIKYCTTRIGLTNKRILIRTNLIFVQVDEVDLEEIKSEHVDNGLLGRFLNYGEIHYDARFVGDISLPDIADPYKLLRKTHEARTRLSDDMDFLPENRKLKYMGLSGNTNNHKRQKDENGQKPGLKKISEDDNYIVYRKT